MVRHACVCALLVATAASLTGCSGFRCRDLCRRSPYAGMKFECCADVCGPVCGPDCCGGCRGKCSPCTCGKCVSCGDKCGACGQKGPGWRGQILNALCGCSGCGELYWSEWYNDPPACCEPCDRCGNYTGPHDMPYFGQPPALEQAIPLPAESPEPTPPTPPKDEVGSRQ